MVRLNDVTSIEYRRGHVYRIRCFVGRAGERREQ